MSSVTPISSIKPQALEFFAGIGLARVGLERAGFVVSWANDIDESKRQVYDAQLPDGASHYDLRDIHKVKAAELPASSSVAWASSPCTDLSLAGGRAGLRGGQSGTFWEFIRVLRELGEQRPPVVVLENVVGLATSHGGDDLVAAIKAFNGLGYSVDVLTLDARRFLPQSRSRLFIVGAMNPPADTDQPNSDLRPDFLQWIYGDPELRTHRAPLPRPPAPRLQGLTATVESMDRTDPRWWDQERSAKFIGALSVIQRQRLDDLIADPREQYRTAYRRTRKGVAVWEIRPDDISGCLRTARGGSSKQAVVRAGNGEWAVRWMTPLEYARLMGAGDFDLTDVRPNQAFFGFGDAVAVPAVEWLGEHYLMPLVKGAFAADPSSLRRNVV